MRELSEVMGGAVEARASSMSGLTPGARLATVKAQVRRRRVTRHTLEGAASLAVVGAVVVAGWFGLGDRNGPPPVATPTPSLTSPPSPDPTSETETPDEPEIVLGDPIEEPGFPTYYEMPDGLLEQVGAGWVLATYAPRAYGEVPPVEVIFVISPDGTRYAAARTDLDVSETSEGRSWVEHEPVTWDGSDLAIFQEVTHVLGPDSESESVGETVTFDLAAGSVVGSASVTPSSGGDSWRAEGPGGRVVMGEWYSDRFTLDPDGSARSDVRYGVDGRVCSAIGWLDVSTLLAVCVVDDEALDADGDGWPEGVRTHDPALFQIPVDGGLPERVAGVGADDSLPGSLTGLWVRDGVVTFMSGAEDPSSCWAEVTAWVDGELRVVQRTGAGGSIDGIDAHDGVVYVESRDACHDETPMALTTHDLSTGTSVDLVPVPQGAWLRTLTGWVVAE